MKMIRVGFCPACGAQKIVEQKQKGEEVTVRVFCRCGGCEDEVARVGVGETFGLEIIPIQFDAKEAEQDEGRDQDDL